MKIPISFYVNIMENEIENPDIVTVVHSQLP